MEAYQKRTLGEEQGTTALHRPPSTTSTTFTIDTLHGTSPALLGMCTGYYFYLRQKLTLLTVGAHDVLAVLRLVRGFFPRPWQSNCHMVPATEKAVPLAPGAPGKPIFLDITFGYTRFEANRCLT